MSRFRLPRIVDLLFLTALSLYALAGVGLAPFHGDESMLLYASSDYVTAFIDGSPQQLTTAPPYFIDSDAHLRILNGSVSRYSIGLVWDAAGYGRADLPPAPGWDWGRSYDDNLTDRRRPTAQQLLLARLPSIAYLVASFAAMFLLAQALGGRTMAYIATTLYALHPAILLNGRRVMQESMVLCFGLLALYLAVLMVKQLKGSSIPVIPRYATLLVLACGLTLASKHSGIVFVAGAFGIVITGYIVAAWQQRERRMSLLLTGGIVTGISGVLAIGLFIALSPALWNDPPARLGNLLAVRAELLDIQTVAAGGAMPLEQRIEKLFTQPFAAPLMYYETQVFAVAPIQAEIARYEASGLSGIHWGIGGWLLTLAAAGGIITTFITRVRPFASAAFAVGMLIVFAIIVASLLANPLPWQRYYLALITMTCLYAATGLVALSGYKGRTMNGGAAFRSRSGAESQ